MKNTAKVWLSVLTLAAGASLIAPVVVAKDPEVLEDGLVLTKSKRVDKLYMRPGATLAPYTKVLLKPMSVQFSKSWDPEDYGTHGLKSEDVQKIRAGVGELVQEVFREELGKGGYAVVDAPGEGVLELEAHVVNLYVNAPAPDSQYVGRSKIYVVNAGEMTLICELRDGVTGTVLARALDRREGSESGRMEWASTGWNRQQAKQIARAWAKALTKALDAAKEEK